MKQLLSTSLDSINEAFDCTDWYETYIADCGEYPNLDDLECVAGTDGDYGRYCYAYDVDGKEVEGIILSWHEYPYFQYNGEYDPTAEDWAYILLENGTTYAHIGDILPL